MRGAGGLSAAGPLPLGCSQRGMSRVSCSAEPAVPLCGAGPKGQRAGEHISPWDGQTLGTTLLPTRLPGPAAGLCLLFNSCAQ